jgi:periplasmic protein TonB
MRLAVLCLITAISLYSQEISHTTDLRVIHKVEPEYTKEALDAKIEGTAILSSMIGTDGVASDIKLVRGLGKGLDEKAVECLRQWRFAPATKFGEPVSTKATIEINFRLPQSPNSK